jgi:hypothetical protein
MEPLASGTVTKRQIRKSLACLSSRQVSRRL